MTSKAKNTGRMSTDDEIILACAFRYALGRMTYVVNTVVQRLLAERNRLSTNMLGVIVRDIREADERGCLGMDCDKADWHIVEASFEEAIRRRMENGEE